MSGERILIIDDSQEIVKHLSERVLPNSGFVILHAHDGQTGLELIRANAPDLILLDFNLPQMTGLEVLQEMSRANISTPVVLMTGYGSELSAIEAFRLGAKDYLIKPFTTAEIIETIDRALLQRRLLHDKTELAERLRRLQVESKRQTQQIRALFGFSKAIAKLHHPEKIIAHMLHIATDLTNATGGLFWQPGTDNGPGALYQISATPAASGKPQIQLERRATPSPQTVEVLASGEPQRSASLAGAEIVLKPDLHVCAIVRAPLRLHGVSYGVLSVYTTREGRAFSQQDELLLTFLADYAAIALENAHLIGQTNDQHAYGMNRTTAVSLDLHTSLQTILDQAQRLQGEDLNDKQSAAVKQIQKAGADLAALVNHLRGSLPMQRSA
jgi:two-component system, NtrC family, sensor kinase